MPTRLADRVPARKQLPQPPQPPHVHNSAAVKFYVMFGYTLRAKARSLIEKRRGSYVVEKSNPPRFSCDIATTRHQVTADPFSPSTVVALHPHAPPRQTSHCLAETVLQHVVLRPPRDGSGVIDTKRFVPQVDLEVLGSAARVQENLALEPHHGRFVVLPRPFLPSHPLMHGSVEYCPSCGLSWLRSTKPGFGVHPFHNTVDRDLPGDSLRSLMVFVHGGGSGGGGPRADRPVTASVSFGPGSPYNTDDDIPNAVAADLTAALRALDMVRARILPDRRRAMDDFMMKAYVAQQDGRPTNASEKLESLPGSEFRSEEGWMPSYGAEVPFRMVLASDSAYLVDNMCDNFDGWELNVVTHTLKDQHGQIVRDGGLFLAINEELCKLKELGIDVRWYLLEDIPRRYE